MRLLHLGTRDFRNLAPVDLPTDARFVVLHGDNAQGKTNALEAVWLLATLKDKGDNAELARVAAACDPSLVGKLDLPDPNKAQKPEKKDRRRRR